MPQGLQTFHANGSVDVDTSKLVMKKIISYQVTANTTSNNTIALSIPVENSVLGVSAAPVANTGNAAIIISEVTGANLVWRARTGDGNNYRLDVMIV